MHIEQPLFVANLSPRVRSYLKAFGIQNVDTDPQQAALIWLHALAVGYSPAYLRENKDGVSINFPRIPLPAHKDALMASAALGRQIADLLDTEKPVEGVTSNSIQPELRGVAVIIVADEHQPDYALKAGWGNPTEAGVMPGRGKVAERGDGALDIYLNDTTCWANVPLAVWEYTLGGYQVLKKWLSYREERVLGRPLRPDEAREFMHNARRIAALLALNDALDASYRACAADTAG